MLVAQSSMASICSTDRGSRLTPGEKSGDLADLAARRHNGNKGGI